MNINRPKVAALAVVLHDGHLLLIKRKNEPDAGLWGFPGGHVEMGERAMDAAARELLEETGVVATPLRFLTNLDVITRDADGAVEHHFLLAAVLCQFQAGLPKPMDDALDAAWVPFDVVSQRQIAMSKDVGHVLQLAQEYSRFD